MTISNNDSSDSDYFQRKEKNLNLFERVEESGVYADCKVEILFNYLFLNYVCFLKIIFRIYWYFWDFPIFVLRVKQKHSVWN